MNGYICYWKTKKVEIHADTSYGAQQKAVVEFQKLAGRKKVKEHDITVMLAEKDGQQVTHNTCNL